VLHSGAKKSSVVLRRPDLVMLGALLAVVNPSSASRFVQIHEHLFLALYEETNAYKMAQHTLKTKYLVVPCLHIVEKYVYESFVPSPLQEIYKFDELANQTARRSSDLRLVFCAGLNSAVQTRVVFLLGCHLVVSLGMDPEQVFSIFHRVENFRSKECTGLLQGWWSLQCAKNMGWINFQDPFELEDGCLDGHADTIRMDEYVHYSRFLCIFSLFRLQPPQHLTLDWQPNQRRHPSPHPREGPPL
jgi:hypothetical protein